MKILELFCGTKSFSKVAQKFGHETFTVDIDPQFNPDLCKDIMDVQLSDIPYRPDIIWASPPCQSFSVASIGKNWNRDYTPKSDKARHSIRLLSHTLKLIEGLGYRYYFIENPRGMMRKLPFMMVRYRRTVTYCQYGDDRMKPTDIWTNLYGWIPRPMCKKGDTCHQSAPRGAKTGTQGLKGSIARSVVPEKLCHEILKNIDEVIP